MICAENSGSHRNFCKDGKKKSQKRKIDANALTPESLPEVLRHCVDTRAHVNGDEDPSEKQQDVDTLNARDKFKVNDC